MNDEEIQVAIKGLLASCGLHVHAIEMWGSSTHGTFQIAVRGSDRQIDLSGRTGSTGLQRTWGPAP